MNIVHTDSDDNVREFVASRTKIVVDEAFETVQSKRKVSSSKIIYSIEGNENT